VTSYFTRLLKSRYWLFAIVAVIWGADALFADPLPAYPLWASLLRSASWGIVLAALLIRYDFLTSFVAHFFALFVLDGVRFYHFGHPPFLIAAGICGVAVLGLVIFALSCLRRDISTDELSQYAPAYVNRIIERERLARELEIARQVQLGFLPRSNPSVPGLDIASVCLPAQEVGGDYYDFIRLGEKRLGIAIGDVSGKGISAAFYMTLTKGFLRSLTRTSLTPRQILVEINSLFYENVERGHFISMIYGVFDLEHHTFTFARAGHNPVICYQKMQGQSRLLCPKGIALGLEHGDIFTGVIQEECVPVARGDTLILYTDGFSEAMNGQHREFGEARIQEIIDMNSKHDAGQLLLSIEKQIKSFVGSTDQHDDMTMVIVQAT
jgi:sigma-B regulation protein RsbU (phosphoserine phosphatase)